MKLNVLSLIICFIVTVCLGKAFIPLLKRFKAGQPILGYVKEHEGKSGTPTMGGIFFIIPVCVVYFFFFGFKRSITNVSVSIGLAFMFVGFIDDFIKIKYRQNEGLKPYQKIVFQLFISGFAGTYAYINGLTSFYVPFIKSTIDLGFFTIFLVSFIFLAITNCVNLTDGLDGLAGTTSVCYLFVLSVIIMLEKSFSALPDAFLNEFDALISLSGVLIGGIFGFLVFNVNKAKVFMGDTGSLSLGAMVGAYAIMTRHEVLLILIGIVFVIETVSCIIQIIYFKLTRKRFFLMTPIHHTLEKKGMSETHIVRLFWWSKLCI